jgi:hypothetical protein
MEKEEREKNTWFAYSEKWMTINELKRFAGNI